jgi:hypothetical protein
MARCGHFLQFAALLDVTDHGDSRMLTANAYLDGLNLEQRRAVEIVPQRFFTHGQSAQGDRHVYASRTRFIPESLLGLFDKTSWPPIAAGTPAQAASQGVRINIGARMRGMWR